MTDPKSRVELALELADAKQPIGTLDTDAHKLAKWLMVGERSRVALANVLLHLVDERETQLHPIAMVLGNWRRFSEARGTSREPARERALFDSLSALDQTRCVCQWEAGDSLCAMHDPAPTSSPSDDKPEAEAMWPLLIAKLRQAAAERYSDPLNDLVIEFEACGVAIEKHLAKQRANLTHEGATAAEWASRSADAELRAKTWKGEHEREAKAAREGRVQVSNLQAELTRLKSDMGKLVGRPGDLETPEAREVDAAFANVRDRYADSVLSLLDALDAAEAKLERLPEAFDISSFVRAGLSLEDASRALTVARRILEEQESR